MGSRALRAEQFWELVFVGFEGSGCWLSRISGFSGLKAF